MAPLPAPLARGLWHFATGNIGVRQYCQTTESWLGERRKFRGAREVPVTLVNLRCAPHTPRRVFGRALVLRQKTILLSDNSFAAKRAKR
jgi:hypothetical protein